MLLTCIEFLTFIVIFLKTISDNDFDSIKDILKNISWKTIKIFFSDINLILTIIKRKLAKIAIICFILFFIISLLAKYCNLYLMPNIFILGLIIIMFLTFYCAISIHGVQEFYNDVKKHFNREYWQNIFYFALASFILLPIIFKLNPHEINLIQTHIDNTINYNHLFDNFSSNMITYVAIFILLTLFTTLPIILEFISLFLFSAPLYLFVFTIIIFIKISLFIYKNITNERILTRVKLIKIISIIIVLLVFVEYFLR